MIVFISGMDIIGAIDPFKIFNPRVLTAAGIIFISAVLLLSLFTYRPWCHLLCPFGLIGWIAEKLSIYKIKVNYTSCIACEKCAKACPSSVMGAILKQDRIIPDCYMCGVCIGVCPTKSISLDSGKRMVPPKGKFQLKQ
jgi:polyferredoxin